MTVQFSSAQHLNGFPRSVALRKKASVFAIVLVWFFSACNAWALDAATGTGSEIMREVDRLHDVDMEMTSLTMTLTDSKGVETVRGLRQLRRRFDDGLVRTLMVIDEPAGVRGTAVLTWENKGSADDQWTYLPALGRLKRIVGSGKQSYFLGTDFTHEDFETEERSEFDYQRQADGMIDEKPCYIVDARPISDEAKEDSGYSKRRIYIDQAHLAIVRIEFFRRADDALIKTLDVVAFDDLGGGRLRAKTSIMRNDDLNHSTKLEVVSRDTSEAGVPVEAFTPNYLTSNQHLR